MTSGRGYLRPPLRGNWSLPPPALTQTRTNSPSRTRLTVSPPSHCDQLQRLYLRNILDRPVYILLHLICFLSDNITLSLLRLAVMFAKS